MSKTVSNSNSKKARTPVRRLTGEERASTGKLDRLILSPNLRVADAGILRLEPKHAVNLSDQPNQYMVAADRSGADIEVKAEPNSDFGSQGAPNNEPPETRDTAAADTPSDGQNIAPPGKENLRSTGITELTAKIAALETAIAKTADQWEPDGASGDAYAGTPLKTMSWQESVELDARGKPVTGQGGTEHSANDEALRDLVSAILKSELEGDLGRRITRNVRKLVQREVRLALAADKSE